MFDSARINYLFNLYIQNTATEAETRELFVLLENQAAVDELEPELQALWTSAQPQQNVQEPNWSQLYQNVTGSNQPETPVIKIKRNRKNLYYAAAAAVFIGVFLAMVFSIFNSNQKSNYLTYTVPFKTTKTIILDDGSKVVLNAGTTIKYPQTFKGKTREVSINGEAYFQVVHLTDKPFIVHSGNLQTQVLGTSFNVNAYAKAATMKVTVLSGKVAVKEASTGKQVMLVAHEQVTLNGNKHYFVKTPVTDAPTTIAWQDDKLVFEDATLAEITLQLELKYGVNTTLSNPGLKNCRISAVFQHKPLIQILDVITRLTNSSYSLQHNQVLITGKGCNAVQ